MPRVQAVQQWAAARGQHGSVSGVIMELHQLRGEVLQNGALPRQPLEAGDVSRALW